VNRTVPAFHFVACLLALVASTRAATAADAAADVDAALVSPLIGETTALVIKLDTARLSWPDLSGAEGIQNPEFKAIVQGAFQGAGESFEAIRQAVGGQAVYATIGIPVSKAEWPMFAFLRESPQVDQGRLLQCLGRKGPEGITRTDSGLLVATPAALADERVMLDQLVPSPREGLADVFRAVEPYPVQVLLLPPAYIRRTVEELMPELPQQLGGGPSSVLTEGLLWAALGLDPSSLNAKLVIQSASPEAAQRLATELPKMLQGVHRATPVLQRVVPREAILALLKTAALEVAGEQILIRMDRPESRRALVTLAIAAAGAVRDQAGRNADMERFKKILLAMHNYHDVYRSFPPREEARDQQGKTGLSWRVHLLPFLDQRELHGAFRLDESWDSPHNRPLIERMPEVYRSRVPNVASGQTTFLAPVGDDTVFGGPKAIRFQDITDGTSNTAVLVEVTPERAVPWTAPQDYTFDPEAPAVGLQTGIDGRFLAGWADGSVHQLRSQASAEAILRLFRKSDGRPLDRELFRDPNAPLMGVSE
jgi:hypothetical protein